MRITSQGLDALGRMGVSQRINEEVRGPVSCRDCRSSVWLVREIIVRWDGTRETGDEKWVDEYGRTHICTWRATGWPELDNYEETDPI